ncbi:MAG: mechanosensitive ion channel family protein [Methylocystaceae bacterium]
MSEFLVSISNEISRRYNSETLASYALAGVKIIVILLAAYIVIKIIDHWVGSWAARINAREGNQRVLTLGRVLQSLVTYITYFIAIVMVLQELNVNTASVLASAGIVGVAVGFGAQSLVKDVISGFFILLENQYAVGDSITIGSDEGTVEDINLRCTRIKGASGEIYIIPNGQINRVVNHSRANRRAKVDIGVGYEADIDKVERILVQICDQMKGALPDIVEGPEVLGITGFAEAGPIFTLTAFTLPGSQARLEREMRRQIKLAFDREGLSMPLPSRILINRGEMATSGTETICAGGHSKNEEKTPLRE